MTASEVGPVPDDVIEEVAMAIANDSDWSRRSESYRDSYRQQARAALSVPSVAEVFARDAKVRELIGNWRQGWTALKLVRAIAALCSEDGAR
jgi:hypothetical protein